MADCVAKCKLEKSMTKDKNIVCIRVVYEKGLYTQLNPVGVTDNVCQLVRNKKYLNYKKILSFGILMLNL